MSEHEAGQTRKVVTMTEEQIRRIVADELAGRSKPVGEADREVLNANQAAEFLGVDRKTVYDYANRGQIPHRKLGKRLLFSRSAIMAWLDPCKAAEFPKGT